MNLDMLINIAIVFFIVVSVLKRMREVTNKAGDITKKPAVAPPQPAGRTAPAPRRTPTPQPSSSGQQETWPFEKVKTPAREQVEQGKSSLRRLLEELERQALPDEAWKNKGAPVVPGDQPGESTFPAYAEREAGVSVSPMRDTFEDMSEEKAYHGEADSLKALGIGFTGGELVRGIVMSEILGPPAALRDTR